MQIGSFNVHKFDYLFWATTVCEVSIRDEAHGTIKNKLPQAVNLWE